MDTHPLQQRFRTNAAGKVKRWKAGKRHNAGPKNRKRIRELGKTAGFSVPKVERKYKNVMLGAKSGL